MTEELKPCPIPDCGGEAMTYQIAALQWCIMCKDHPHQHRTKTYETEAEAIAAWNKRDDRYQRMWEELDKRLSSVRQKGSLRPYWAAGRRKMLEKDKVEAA